MLPKLVFRMKRRHLIGVVITVFLTWNLLTYYMLVSRQHAKEHPGTLTEKLQVLEADIHQQLKENEKLLEKLKHYKRETGILNTKGGKLQPTQREPIKSNKQATVNKVINHSMLKEEILPVLVIACDRTEVSRSLDQLIKFRSSSKQFPIIVSQDCGHEPTAQVIAKYKDQVTHIKQPDLSDFDLVWPQKKFKGYYKIARHYRWALNQIFHTFNYSAVITVEDDLDISPDFFEYFAATYPILQSDPFLWCVSAWNDNGKTGMVSDDADLLYRTDFFPGLGWMMERKTWLELEPKWPKTFWDDWMRHPDQRRNQECIRPEICRTSTFGKKGVSKGQFYEKHLKFIKLNNKYVPFTEKDLSYLHKDIYDAWFVKTIYEAPVLTVAEVINGAKPECNSIRVQYNTKNEFKSFAKQLGIMDDLKAGVPRGGYRGVVSFMFQSRRVYLSPPATWKVYNPTWN